MVLCNVDKYYNQVKFQVRWPSTFLHLPNFSTSHLTLNFLLFASLGALSLPMDRRQQPKTLIINAYL